MNINTLYTDDVDGISVTTVSMTTASYKLPSSDIRRDNDNDSFGCTSDTNIFYEIYNNELQLYDNNNDIQIKCGVTDVKLIMLPNTLFHIIDQGNVVYLMHLQIRFYDQQDSLMFLQNNDTNDNISSSINHRILGIQFALLLLPPHYSHIIQ